MNQYTALCPQAFENLTPGRLQKAPTGMHAKMQPVTNVTRMYRAIRTGRRLTVKLSGRARAPDQRRRLTLSFSAGGAYPLAPHGPLQRL
jgi:hypothetical protein